MAASCRPASLVAFLLAGYVIAFADLVALTYVLSVRHWVTRPGMGIALGVTLATAMGIWLGTGRPRPPSPVLALRELGRCLRDPLLAVAAAAVAVATTYSLALLLFTPQNEGDALAYHLPRAMFWRQAHAVSYIPGAIETRLNVNPPNAEMATLFTMLFSGVDRYVGLVQFAAYVASTLAVYRIGRSAGLEATRALLGSLLFAMLPVVALQASGALNDLVVASFLACAAAFLRSARTADLTIAALALGLALGTKFTAFFGLPLLAAIFLLGPGRRRWRLVAVLGIAAAAAGSVWYGVNLVETHHLDGGLSASASQGQKHSFGWIALTLWRLCLDALDFSGTAGLDMAAYPVAAVILLGLFLVLRRRQAGLAGHVRAATLVAVAPFAVLALGIALKGGVQFLLTHGGRSDMAEVIPSGLFRPSGQADTTRSWFGPSGALLAIAMPVVAVRRLRRGAGNVLDLVLAAAPSVLVVELALTLVYDQWRGRFVIFAFALAAATWSTLLERRAIAWAAVIVSATTLTMSGLHYLGKPSGAWSLDVANEDVPTISVWGKPRWYVQTLLRMDPHERAEGAVIRFVEQRVPKDATLALAPRGNDFLSPYFGATLSRRIELVRRDGGSVPRAATWLVVSPGGRVSRCRSDWALRLAGSGGWRVEQRLRHGSCGRGPSSS